MVQASLVTPLDGSRKTSDTAGQAYSESVGDSPSRAYPFQMSLSLAFTFGIAHHFYGYYECRQTFPNLQNLLVG